MLLKGVVDGEWDLTAESERKTLADAEVRAVLERISRRGIVNADLNAGASWRWFESAAASVANLANRDGGMPKVQFAVFNLKVVFGCGDVLVDADFRLGGAGVLDFYFEVERWDAFEGHGDDFFAV